MSKIRVDAQKITLEPLFSHHLSFQLFMEDARIKVEIVSADIPKVELDTFDQTYNDGKWHTVELAMSKDKAILTIDSEPMETKRILNIATGKELCNYLYTCTRDVLRFKKFIIRFFLH